MKSYEQLEREAADLLVEASRLRRENRKLRTALQRICADAAEVHRTADVALSTRYGN